MLYEVITYTAASTDVDWLLEAGGSIELTLFARASNLLDEDAIMEHAGKDGTSDFEDLGHSGDARKLAEDYSYNFV